MTGSKPAPVKYKGGKRLVSCLTEKNSEKEQAGQESKERINLHDSMPDCQKKYQ